MTPQRHQRLSGVLDRRQPDLGVVLENVFDPHNVSAVMRSCDAVGIQHIYILNDKIPPHKKWGYRSSSTAASWLTIQQFTNAEECFATVRKQYEKIYAAYLKKGAMDLYAMDFTTSLAMVFGNETFGVSESARKYSDGDFVIPQMGVIKSLNISVACAVTLYEALRQKRMAGHYRQAKLEASERKSLEQRWGF